MDLSHNPSLLDDVFSRLAKVPLEKLVLKDVDLSSSQFNLLLGCHEPEGYSFFDSVACVFGRKDDLRSSLSFLNSFSLPIASFCHLDCLDISKNPFFAEDFSGALNCWGLDYLSDFVALDLSDHVFDLGISFPAFCYLRSWLWAGSLCFNGIKRFFFRQSFFCFGG